MAVKRILARNVNLGKIKNNFDQKWSKDLKQFCELLNILLMHVTELFVYNSFFPLWLQVIAEFSPLKNSRKLSRSSFVFDMLQSSGKCSCPVNYYDGGLFKKLVRSASSQRRIRIALQFSWRNHISQRGTCTFQWNASHMFWRNNKK